MTANFPHSLDSSGKPLPGLKKNLSISLFLQYFLNLTPINLNSYESSVMVLVWKRQPNPSLLLKWVGTLNLIFIVITFS